MCSSVTFLVSGISQNVIPIKATFNAVYSQNVPAAQMQKAVEKLWQVRDWTKTESLLEAV